MRLPVQMVILAKGGEVDMLLVWRLHRLPWVHFWPNLSSHYLTPLLVRLPLQFSSWEFLYQCLVS